MTHNKDLVTVGGLELIALGPWWNHEFNLNERLIVIIRLSHGADLIRARETRRRFKLSLQFLPVTIASTLLFGG